MFPSIWFGSVSDWKIPKNLALASSVLWTRSSGIPLRVYVHWATILLDRLEMCSGSEMTKYAPLDETNIPEIYYILSLHN
jgi:hypothetical protein